MDTIIYVYLKKGYETQNQQSESYQRQDFSMGTYHLVKVGVSSRLWSILQEKDPEEQNADKLEEDGVWRVIHFRKKRESRRKEIARQQRLIKEAECRQCFLQELLEDREHCYFVTEEPIPILEGWSFRGYWEEEWVMHLMQHATLNHFIILGTAECIPVIILKYIRKMKSLRWILQKKQFRDAEQELIEEIYEEYGLAVEVRLLEEEKDYRRMLLVSPFPVVVIDFSKEIRIPTADVKVGSIWLDMSALEEKRRRVEERNTGIAYFSLKKEWKQPQKAPYQLDTNSKNGYNT